MEPSQPPSNAAYTTEGNPTTSNPAEQREAHNNHPQGRIIDERRKPSSNYPQDQEAVPSSLGYGIHGAPPGEERSGKTDEQIGRHQELEGDKMRMLNEGEVADAVHRKPGATGSQPDLASDLDRKKQEQASKRGIIKEQKEHGQVSEFGDARAAQQEGLGDV
ncbi:hypothetical protein SLS62_006000 [Diatrype stigma]|uniref:Uncharacterized protein n=1 Tax=Diatrype stigma TaxID=117547 RepID=A0AAN9UQ76_9PEZI